MWVQNFGGNKYSVIMMERSPLSVLKLYAEAIKYIIDHAGYFPSIFSHSCGLQLSAQTAQKIFSSLRNIKISIPYEKSARKFEPTYLLGEY